MLKLIFHKDNKSMEFSVKVEASNLKLTARWYSELPSVSGLASFLPVPVGGRKLFRHAKARLRMSPGSNNEVYLSRCIL
jgi:hypothetical protein